MHCTHGFVLALFAFSGAAAAQIPRGELLVASFNPGRWHGAHGQTGGLFTVHPQNPGQWRTINGLPQELTGNGLWPFSGGVGANAVAVLPGGDALVGVFGQPGSPLHVYRIRVTAGTGGQLTGQIVPGYPIPIAHVLRTASEPAEVTDLDLLPDGSVLISLNGDLAPPMTGEKLARLDLATLGVTPIPLRSTLAIESINAIALGTDGATAYLGEFTSGASGRVWALPLTPLGMAQPLTNLIGGVLSLDRDNRGDLIVGTLGAVGQPWGTPPALHRVDVASGVVTDLLPRTPGVRNGVVVECETGAIIATADTNLVRIDGASQSLLVDAGTARWGVVAGLSRTPALTVFGDQHGGSARYVWQIAPNAGGLPVLGNANFSITFHSTARPTLSSYHFGSASIAPWQIPGVPFRILLDPAAFIASVPSTGLPATIPLPIPNEPSLRGVSIFAQSFHVENGQGVSSEGLEITIL